ncbi:MAG: hypothetical protein HY886_06375 [Deltaproteobacteria bacterium]|nr:hypothetical protein [Deltaproteobacteria bacterium]
MPRNHKKPRIEEIGHILKTLRTDLSLSLRDVSGRLGLKNHRRVADDEFLGFAIPPWSKYIKLYKEHPDLRGEEFSYGKLLDPNFLTNGKLYKNLIGLYGRDNLAKNLGARTNAEVLNDLQEKAKVFEWRPEDIDCMRRRVGVLKFKKH